MAKWVFVTNKLFVSMFETLIFNIILKVGGFLNAELAEKQFPGITVMLGPVLCALNGKTRDREVIFL